MAKLVLSLLGGFSVTFDGAPVQAFESDKVRALLAYLAFEADQVHRREALAGLFWPDKSEKLARRSLSQSLYNLQSITNNRNIDPPFLTIYQQEVQFNQASNHSLDTKTFYKLAKTYRHHRHSSPQTDPCYLTQLHEAVNLYSGDLLKGVSLSDSAPFEEWLLLNRERYNQTYVELLQHLVTTYEQQHKYETAIPYCQRWVESDPYQEEAHYKLIEMLAQIGRRSDAIAQFEKCAAILRDEIGVAPSPKFNFLIEQIRAGEPITADSSSHYDSALPQTYTICSCSAQQTSPIRLHNPVPFNDSLPLLGRNQELAQLTRLLKLTLCGQGQVTFVSGEAGRGKSALVEAFCQQAQSQHEELIVVGGSCDAHAGMGIPYVAFRDIMTLLTDGLESTGGNGLINKIQGSRLADLFPSVVQAILEVGPNLLDFIVPTRPFLRRIESVLNETRWVKQIQALCEHRDSTQQSLVLRQNLLCTQLASVLEWLAQRHPMVLILDHLQWADADTIDMLFHIGMRAKNLRLMIIGCYRPSELIGGHTSGAANGHHPLLSVIDELTRHFNTIEIALERDSDLEFVNSYLDYTASQADSEFRYRLDRETAGNPLFIKELMQSLAQYEKPAQMNKQVWRSERLHTCYLTPKRIEAMIAEQIRRLPAHLYQLLVVASVEGDCFTAEVLAGVLSLDQRVVIQQLSGVLVRHYHLISAHEVTNLGLRQVCRYKFRQAIVRRYLYELLDNVQRTLLHNAIHKTLQELSNP